MKLDCHKSRKVTRPHFLEEKVSTGEEGLKSSKNGPKHEVSGSLVTIRKPLNQSKFRLL